MPFTPGPWAYYLDEESNHFGVYRQSPNGIVGELIAEIYGTKGYFAANARLVASAPLLYAALFTLVSADNVNYARDTMRYEGLFDAGRAALEAATGWQSVHPDDSPIWTPAESAPALRDMLSLLLRTVNDTLRHGLTSGQRESLEELSRRAGLLLRETPSNE